MPGKPKQSQAPTFLALEVVGKLQQQLERSKVAVQVPGESKDLGDGRHQREHDLLRPEPVEG